MIKDTMYAKYVKQRKNCEILENEYGFVVYKNTGDECFIDEMFVDESARKNGKGRELINALEQIAKSNYKKVITGNIYLNDPNCNETLISALLVGFKVVRAEHGLILILKEIKE